MKAKLAMAMLYFMIILYIELLIDHCLIMMFSLHFAFKITLKFYKFQLFKIDGVCLSQPTFMPFHQGRTQKGAAGAVAPQRKLNLQFLFYFKYIGQNKSCLIFEYTPWQKNPAYGPAFHTLGGILIVHLLHSL